MEAGRALLWAEPVGLGGEAIRELIELREQRSVAEPRNWRAKVR